VSFVTTAPEFVTAAAGNLAGIGSALGEAAAAAAGPTTSVAAAASDEVSTAVSQLFGTYARQFQALSAEATAFHDGFVSLLNSGAAAYLDTEMANTAAATDPLLGGLTPTLGGLTPTLGGLAPTLGGLDLGSLLLTGGPLGPLLGNGALSPILDGVGQDLGGILTALVNGGPLISDPPASGSAWQRLFANTGTNLQKIFGTWAAHPFPVLNQVIINQNHYSQIFWNGVATDLQGFPANVPANVELAIQGASTFDPAALAQAYLNQQIASGQSTGTSLNNAGKDFGETVPIFEYDMGLAGQAVMVGDYHGAVQHFGQGFLNLFVTGIDASDMSHIKLEGPAGDLLPSGGTGGITGPQDQFFVSLLPPGSIPRQMLRNFFNTFSTLTTSVGFAAVGPPIATLGGIATGATAFSAAAQAGDGVGAVGALVDMPAYALDGFLNGETTIDLTLPLTTTLPVPLVGTLLGPVTVPMVIHFPFDGILVEPQPITATVDLSVLGLTTVPIDLTLGGRGFGGLIPELLNGIPQQIASTISPSD
jgi:PE family